MTPDAFKKELDALVRRALTAGAGTQEKLASRAGYDASNVTKAIRVGPNYRLPTRDVTEALVTTCWRFIDPQLPQDKLQDEVDGWLLRRDEAACEPNSQPCEREDRLVEPAQPDKLAAISRIAGVRTAVTANLVRYLELTKRMGEFEKAFDLFYAQTLTGRSELLLLRTQRELLEAAYRRIQPKARSGELDADEIKEEVTAALKSLDLDCDTDPGPDPIIGLGPVDTFTVAPEQSLGGHDDDLDVATRERIYRTFKRTVLKAVHPDTSDAELSDFAVALAAYKSDDHTLMEAFSIRYQDNIGTDEDGKLLELAQLTTRLQNYQAALKRLDTRLIALEDTAASIGMNSLEATYDRMRRELARLRTEITTEVVRIREVEHGLQSLIESTHTDGDGGPDLPDTHDTDQYYTLVAVTDLDRISADDGDSDE